jgi:hypothetical protein
MTWLTSSTRTPERGRFPLSAPRLAAISIPLCRQAHPRHGLRRKKRAVKGALSVAQRNDSNRLAVWICPNQTRQHLDCTTFYYFRLLCYRANGNAIGVSRDAPTALPPHVLTWCRRTSARANVHRGLSGHTAQPRPESSARANPIMRQFIGFVSQRS